MSGEVAVIAAFLLAFAGVMLITPVAIRIARRTDFHDKPGGYKAHAGATPYLGGAAVVCGFLAGASVLDGGFGRFGPIIAAAALLWLVGTIDDRRTVSPGKRVLAEVLAATLLWSQNLGWEIFGGDIPNLIATVLWVVAIVNAFNLMDNMDGAATTVAGISAAGIGVLAIVEDDPVLGGMAFGLAGACLAFLRYNLAQPSARIFLGDGGSMTIGFILAALIMTAPLGNDVGISAPLSAILLVGLPVLDTSLVIISRRRRGVPIVTGGRDHLTHRISLRVGSPRRVALTLCTVQAVLCALALVANELGRTALVPAAAACLVLALAAVAVLELLGWHPSAADAQPERSAG